MKKPIDLRSDTVTQPGPGMRQAIAEAAVGEDLQHEDPTVTLLESRVADLFGREAALFVPTGTMGNLVALKAHTQPGDEVILEERSHIYDCELAGLSAFCGLLARPIRGAADGTLSWDDIRPRIRPRVTSRSQTRLICLENTHNFAGGQVLDQDAVDEVCVRARDAGLRLHLDGARLANASVAAGRSLASLSAGFDSVMIDFAKGLGAPAGAIVVGDAGWTETARRIRKMLGGAIHQPGILAAACLYGLDHLLPQLEQDHRNAKRLAHGLAAVPGIDIDPDQVVTNIVIAGLSQDLDSERVCANLSANGVLAMLLEDGRLRFVTHCDVGKDRIDDALRIIRTVLESLRTGVTA